MFKLICLLVFVTAACAASIGSVESTTEKRPIVPLLRFERENNPDGSFSFSYEGGDQTFREETAHVVDAGTDDETLEVSGSYRYIDEGGNLVEVHYTAGRNGFVPTGTNILSEITASARAAADLPHLNDEETNRKGRANEGDKAKTEHHKAEEQEADESKVSEQRVKIPKVEEKKKVEVPKKVVAAKVEQVQKEQQIPVAIVQEEVKTKTV